MIGYNFFIFYLPISVFILNIYISIFDTWFAKTSLANFYHRAKKFKKWIFTLRESKIQLFCLKYNILLGNNENYLTQNKNKNKKKKERKKNKKQIRKVGSILGFWFLNFSYFLFLFLFFMGFSIGKWHKYRESGTRLFVLIFLIIIFFNFLMVNLCVLHFFFGEK